MQVCDLTGSDGDDNNVECAAGDNPETGDNPEREQDNSELPPIPELQRQPCYYRAETHKEPGISGSENGSANRSETESKNNDNVAGDVFVSESDSDNEDFVSSLGRFAPLFPPIPFQPIPFQPI
jgi:hypothetical protein